jgi:hypothetical protein
MVFPPAYQQVLKGMPAVNYSARDIIYRPRNVRAHKVYGYSPVQQVLMTVNIALRRQLWQLDYFTEGSIPDALIGVPQGWTPEQIKQFQDYWDTEFAGDLAKRRRAKFVPGDTAAKVVQTKERQHKDDFDEWLARIICFAFSVPPQWAVKLMNRATADNQSAQSEEEGLDPTKEWVKDLVDEIITEEFSSPDLELHWLDEDADAAGLEASLEGRVKLGAVTLNEMRDHLGLDPYANAAADRPMVLTPTGYVPIEANAEGVGDASANTNGQAAPAVEKYSPNQPRVPAGNPDGGQWTSEGGSGSSSQSSNGSEPTGASRPVQYAALDTGIRTDAPITGGGRLSSSNIPADDPKHPVPFLDSAGNPILDDQGNPLLRPANLPPELYVSEGLAFDFKDRFAAAQQNGLDAEMQLQLMADLVAQLANFRQGGPWDAERVQGQRVSDYRDYANIAIGLYMAAAGIDLDDALSIADKYALIFSSFEEPMDETYTHSSKRDVRDMEIGYELYESGRISPEK